MRSHLLTYTQKIPVSPLQLVRDPGWGFVLEIGIVSHHGLAIALVTLEGLLVVFVREVIGAQGGIVALLHHLQNMLST
jgi:hypothetical protein